MSSEEIESIETPRPRPMTFANSRVPFVGSLIDYVGVALHYSRQGTFTGAEKLQPKVSRATLSATFLAIVCLMLGFVANVKLEAVRFDGKPLENDLHFMLMSKEDNIYTSDIDPSRVLWCLEASDCAVLFISCLLVWNSSNVRSPISEYLFLPWLGVTLRGLILRQIPTVSALIYTMAMVEDRNVNSVFITTACFLFLLEARMFVEIARLVRGRWERRLLNTPPDRSELKTLWSNEDDDVLSVEMRNFVY